MARKPNPPGRCIFCGDPGLTREHVLPDWLRAIFPRLPTDTHRLGTIDWLHLPNVGAVPLSARKLRQGQAGSKKVRVVCKRCNTGWLSTMEEATKLLLEPLVIGGRLLTIAEQRQLATWIAKTTMTAEFLVPKQVSIKQLERQEFRLRGEPGSHWQIWIAFYLGVQFQAGYIFHHGIGVYLPPKPVRVGARNTQYTVIALGRLLAISLSSEEEEGLSFGVSDQYEHVIRKLWPPKGATSLGRPKGVSTMPAQRSS